jgi:hypothetical protein
VSETEATSIISQHEFKPLPGIEDTPAILPILQPEYFHLRRSEEHKAARSSADSSISAKVFKISMLGDAKLDNQSFCRFLRIAKLLT